jgi:hypothetical protein
MEKKLSKWLQRDCFEKRKTKKEKICRTALHKKRVRYARKRGSVCRIPRLELGMHGRGIGLHEPAGPRGIGVRSARVRADVHPGTRNCARGRLKLALDKRRGGGEMVRLKWVPITIRAIIGRSIIGLIAKKRAKCREYHSYVMYGQKL